MLAILASISNYCFSQKKFKTKGTAQVKMEGDLSKEGTRSKAKQLATVNAIENVLGTYVEQETNIDIEEGETSFKIIGNSKVKGEWIKTDKLGFKEDLVAAYDLRTKKVNANKLVDRLDEVSGGDAFERAHSAEWIDEILIVVNTSTVLERLDGLVAELPKKK